MLLVIYQPHGLLLGVVASIAPVLPAAGAKGGSFGAGHILLDSKPGVGKCATGIFTRPHLLA